MKRSCVLLAAPALAVVLASSVVLHGAVLVAIVVGTGLAACLASTLTDAGPAAAVEAAWKAAAGFFVVSTVTACLVVVAGGAAATVFLLLVGAAAGVASLRWYLRGRLRDRTERGTGPDEDQVPEGTSPAGPPDQFWVPVSLLPTPALGREWQRTEAALVSAREPESWDEVVRRRQEVLDEVERRDPNGFARWLAAGAPATGGLGAILYG